MQVRFVPNQVRRWKGDNFYGFTPNGTKEPLDFILLEDENNFSDRDLEVW